MLSGECKFTPVDVDFGRQGLSWATDQRHLGNTDRGQLFRAVLETVDILICLLRAGSVHGREERRTQ